MDANTSVAIVASARSFLQLCLAFLYHAKKAPDEAGESCGQPDQCRFALPAHSQTLTAFVNDAAQNMEPIDVGGVAEAVGTCKKTHKSQKLSIM